MELHVILIGAAVFVVSAILIYLISAFTMKEKTFEEVMAEQKKQQEAEQQKAKLEKKAEKDTTRKRFKKKEKVKGDQSPKVSAQPTVEFNEPKMVNLELEPEIIEPVEDKPIKMKKKDKPTKPILHNKDEKTPIVSEDFVEEMVHRGPTPMDDVELKHLQDLKKDKKKDRSKKQDADAQQPKPVVEEMMKVTESKVQAAAPPMMDAKPTYSKMDNANAKLIASVKSASLNDTEVQSIIDVLLSKQGGASAAMATDWSKKSQKGDPVTMLKKQLEEKERILQEEQQMVMAANTKMKEIRMELNTEKVKFQAMEKSYKEKIDFQGREVQALQSRIQHTHEQHMVETNQLRTVVQQLEAQTGDQSKVQRLADENKTLRDTLNKVQSETLSAADANNLKQKVSIMEKELSSNALKLNASENTKKTLEQKLAKFEAQLKKYETQQANADSIVEKRVDEVSQELRKSEAKNAGLGQDLKKAEQAVDAAHKECVALKSKLQELEKSLIESDQSTRDKDEKLKAADRQKTDMEGNLKNLQKRLDDYNSETSGLKTQIQSLKQENTELSAELKTSRERQQGEGQEAPSKAPAGAQNGDVHEEATSSKIDIAQHEKILSEKDSEISRLATEVENRKTELSSLQQDLEKQKKKNNDLREKNWKAMDALEKTEKSVSEKVESAIKDQREDFQASQTDLEEFDKSVLQRLFPDISVKEKVHKDWMTGFEKQVSNYISSLKQNQQSTSDNILTRIFPGTSQKEKSAKYENRISELESQSKELESQRAQFEQQSREACSARDRLQTSLDESETSCSKLQNQVAQYRNVLAETENKLTQLENSVESEERKWQERLQEKEAELQAVQTEAANLKQEVKATAGSQEMKDRVIELETELKISEEKCSGLESKIVEAEKKVVEYKVQIEEVQKTSAMATDLNDELEALRKQLEAEKKKNKELASNVVKLNGIIKTGHDALSQEQSLVEKLKAQLVDVANQNSSSSSSTPSVINVDVDKLKAQLEEKDKQLEKEINSNKLLSQRLAQLGVMAASQSSLNEAGTSV